MKVQRKKFSLLILIMVILSSIITSCSTRDVGLNSDVETHQEDSAKEDIVTSNPTHTDKNDDEENFAKEDVVPYIPVYTDTRDDEADGGYQETIHDDGVVSDIEMYQGIFMKDDIFLSIPMYTGEGDGNYAVGVAYQVTKPVKKQYSSPRGPYSIIESDMINDLGEVYCRGNFSNKNYYIEGDNFKANIIYKNKRLSIQNVSGAEQYEGDYMQVSNSGANMHPNDVWLNIPGDV